ncbi:major facilitator superfamily domain-containing protein [Aspergillus bertholletiae]|uniref:Major facilitator superfamily domain-containing protein n=1 Tax=Aspergillus bertholletiae TaxID=1226010 RepID=A0A5N7BCC4_9EURO|nr:major facilitator superfamily domain-containing protein [Aspergillus bertholletiae]
MVSGQGLESEISTPLLGTHPRGPHIHYKHRRWILFLLCTVIVTLDFGTFLSIAPQTQIMESIICRKLHPGLFIDLPYGQFLSDTTPCKSVDVQGELALISGWKDTLDQIPGIILALPLGFLLDRIGRKPIAMLSMSGLLMEEIAIRIICLYSEAIPLRAIWLTPLFQLCGGGSQIASSVAFTIVTDIFPAEQRANLFFMLFAAVLLAEILATPLSAWLMSWSPWLPFLLGWLCEGCGLLAAILIPETLPKSSCELESESPDEERDGLAPPLTSPKWKESLSSAGSHIMHLTAFFWGNFNTVAISIAFLAASVGGQALQLIIQYASKRFSWTMAKASFLISLKGIIDLVVLLLLLPTISHFLNRHLSPAVRDLRITQGSAAVLAVGFAIMAVAGQPALFAFGVSILALGWGFYSTLRNVATTLVAESQIGTLNTTIALVQGVGSMLAGPLLASAFRKGMVLGGIWMGLPYMVGALLFLLAGLAASSIRTPR